MFTLKEFLKNEVKPALGCTEPGAVALAVARACQELPTREMIQTIKVAVSDGIYKNGMAVGIPGANGARGNAVAAALGAICGKSEYGLQVLQDCSPEDVVQAEQMVREKQIQITCHPEKHGVYIEAIVEAPPHHVICIIEKEHANIVKVVKDGLAIYESNTLTQNGNAQSIAEQAGQLSYSELLQLVDQMDAEDMDYLLEGVRMNLEIADYGFRHDSLSGLSLGKTMKSLIAENMLQADLSNTIKSYCYAAADARMAGAQLSVMSSAGSGNHGIAAILPIALVGAELGKERIEIARALAVSHLSTSMVKSKLGRLSAVCGCAVAAGAGAAAGLTYLIGGSIAQCTLAMKTVLADTAGMICDGAKGTCSLKAGTAGAEAYMASLFALQNRGVDDPEGVIGFSLEQTTDNMGLINREGMGEVDRVMIKILEKRG